MPTAAKAQGSSRAPGHIRAVLGERRHGRTRPYWPEFADQTAILLVYAPKDGDLRTLFIPLDG